MIHSEALVGHLAKRSQEALREYVPRDRAAWLAQVKGLELATDRGTHVVMLSAGSGAVVLGCTGGVVGTCGGATAGTIAGVVPALLTFGLSLPAGAVVGGGVGGCLGAAAGTLSGLVGGGASGGVAYRYRAEIGDGAVHIKVRHCVPKTGQPKRHRSCKWWRIHGLVQRRHTLVAPCKHCQMRPVRRLSARRCLATLLPQVLIQRPQSLEQTPKPWHSTLPRKQLRQELQVVPSPLALQVAVLVCWQVALQELPP